MVNVDPNWKGRPIEAHHGKLQNPSHDPMKDALLKGIVEYHSIKHCLHNLNDPKALSLAPPRQLYQEEGVKGGATLNALK